MNKSKGATAHKFCTFSKVNIDKKKQDKKLKESKYISFEGLASLVIASEVKKKSKTDQRHLKESKSATSIKDSNTDLNSIKIRREIMQLRDKRIKTEIQSQKESENSMANILLPNSLQIHNDPKHQKNKRKSILYEHKELEMEKIKVIQTQYMEKVESCNTSAEWSSNNSNDSLIDKLLQGTHPVFTASK